MKSWKKSKTIWFNVLMIVLGAAPIIAESAKVLTPGSAAVIDSVLGLVAGIGNVVLRVVFTETAIATPLRYSVDNPEARR